MDCETMDCRKVEEELLFLFIDHEMGAELLIAFRRHVADCPGCASRARYTERFLTIIRQRAFRCHAPHQLRDRILARLPHRSVAPG